MQYAQVYYWWRRFWFLVRIEKWRENIWICITDRSSFKHNVSRVYGMAFAHNLYKQFYDYKWHKIQYEAATIVSCTRQKTFSNRSKLILKAKTVKWAIEKWVFTLHSITGISWCRKICHRFCFYLHVFIATTRHPGRWTKRASTKGINFGSQQVLGKADSGEIRRWPWSSRHLERIRPTLEPCARQYKRVLARQWRP